LTGRRRAGAGRGVSQPTTGTQYEVGVRYQPKKFDALFSAAFFDLTQQNVLTTDPVNTGFNVQTGEIASRGVELEAKATIMDGLSVVASYAYLDAEVTKANDASEGNRPVGIPANLASAWVDYALPGKLLRGLRLGGGLGYRGTFYGNTTNTFKIDAVTLVDAAVHYDLGVLDTTLKGAEPAVNVSNLLDTEYVGRCQNNGCYYGLRRNVFGTVTYRW